MPVLGVSDGTPAIDQPGQVTDPDGLLNAVPEDAGADRTRLATRPGLVLEYGGAKGSGAVRLITEIARASGVVGTAVDTTVRDTTGSQRGAGSFRGQAVVLETDWSVRALIDDQRGTGAGVVAPPVNAGGYGGFLAAWHATDSDIAYIGTIAKNTTLTTQDVIVMGLTRFNLATETVVQNWVVDADPGYSAPLPGSPQQAHLVGNRIVQFGPYLFVAAFRSVFVYDATTLEYLSRANIPWCEEVQDIAVFTAGGVDRLAVLFSGNYAVQGPVVADAVSTNKERFGEFYRSGISLWTINYTVAATKTPMAVGQTVLVQTLMPQGTQSGDAGYENHRTYRFAEYGLTRPRGCIPFSMAVQVDAEGSVWAYVARTNQGWGYDGSQEDQRPDGRAPFVSVCRVNLTRAIEDGAPVYVDPASPVRYGPTRSVGGWEIDTGSLRRGVVWGTQTFAHDIPVLAGVIDPVAGDARNPQAINNEPTLWAIAFNATANIVVVAGRRPSLSTSGSTVFGLDPETGGRLWDIDLRQTAQQQAVAIDVASGSAVVGTYRGPGWESQDGTPAPDYAEMFQIDLGSGQVRRTFDLTDAVNFNGFIGISSAIGVFGVAVNARGQTLAALAPYRYDV